MTNLGLAIVALAVGLTVIVLIGLGVVIIARGVLGLLASIFWRMRRLTRAWKVPG